MKGRRALDPEESAFLKLIASVLKEDSSATPRAQQGNAVHFLGIEKAGEKTN